MEDVFIPIEDEVGPHIHYHVDPLDIDHGIVDLGKLGRLVVLQEPTGQWAIDEEGKAKIKEA